MNSWQVVDTANGSNLTDISCASATFCAATDESGNVVMLSGRTWTSPIGIDPGNQLNSVSCPTASFCLAVDNGSAFTYTGSATNWAQSTIASQTGMNSVSCPSSGFCVAVDTDGNEYTYNGSNWTRRAEHRQLQLPDAGLVR